MTNEKKNCSVLDEVRLVSTPRFRKPAEGSKAEGHRPEDEPTIEMTQAEVEEMLRKANYIAARTGDARLHTR